MSRLVVNEVFGPTWQGEGKSVGQVCWFLRLGGCNQHCVWCFGVKPGRRIPRVTLSSVPNKKIHDVEIGDKLLTFDSGRNLVETEVINVINREVEQWYEITIDNILYYVTSGHPFFTTRGLVNAEDLRLGDMIYHLNYKDKLGFRMRGDKNPMTNSDTVKKSKESTDYQKLGQQVSDTVQRKKQEGTYVSTWDLMTDEQKESSKEKHRISKLGSSNPNWAGGPKYPNWDLLKELCRNKVFTSCEICGKKERLQVHHIDETHENDEFENMQLICHQCHSQIHKRGYNFWVSERSDGKVISSDIVPSNGKEVQKIKYVDITRHRYYGRHYGPKPLKVYNLSCHPYNTYLVDYMWVHNCDTAYTWRFSDKFPHNDNIVYDKAKEIKVTPTREVIDKFLEINPPMLVISGGEPMLQSHEIWMLADELLHRAINLKRIEIETAGIIFDNGVRQLSQINGVFFNVSPKLENSGNPLSLRYNEEALWEFNRSDKAVFKFVVTCEEDLQEIEEIINEVRIPQHKVWCMVEGRTNAEQEKGIETFVPKILDKGWNFTPRLHVQLWGDKRGV